MSRGANLLHRYLVMAVLQTHISKEPQPTTHNRTKSRHLNHIGNLLHSFVFYVSDSYINSAARRCEKFHSVSAKHIAQ